MNTLRTVNPDPTVIREAVATMFDEDQLVELRCIPPHPDRVVSGFYDDFDKLAADVLVADQEGCQCYMGLNPRMPENCSVSNELRIGRTAGNSSIACRRWLLIDVDPHRQTADGNQQVSSTDDEKKAAKALLDHVVEVLSIHKKWPKPMICDSGNGYHALYRIELPADDKGLVSNALKALGEFSTSKASVDTSVSDAARIVRVPGTTNRKGVATAERPHRKATIIAKGEPVVVTRTLLQKVANMKGKSARKTRPEIVSQARDWMKDHPLKNEECSSNNKEPFAIACKLIVDFGLDVHEAAPILDEYNERRTANGFPKQSIETLNRSLEFAKQEACQNPARVGNSVKQPDDEDKRPQADLLLEIILEQYLWITAKDESYATVEQNGVVKNFDICSREFSRWLGGEFIARYGCTARPKAKAEAVEAAEEWAWHDGAKNDAFVRIGECDGKFYLDLANDAWEAVEIDGDGWRIITDPPAKFRRAKGMLPLPTPIRGGNIRELREFVNVSSDEDFFLVVGWLVMTLNPTRGFPLLVLGGQQGSSKSTTAELLSSLIDPNRAALIPAPSGGQDMAIIANSRRVLVLDNLSFLKDELSDALCRLATGAATMTRKLYTDADPMILDFCNPTILNGIVDLARRPDLLERSILVELPRLICNKTSTDFWAAFNEAHPRILGAILDAVSFGIANPKQIPDLPRMAEFANFVASVEPELCKQWNSGFGATSGQPNGSSFWKEGDFMTVYKQNLDTAEKSAVEQSSLATAVIEFAKKRTRWQGTPTELFNELGPIGGRLNLTHDRLWPKSAQSLGQGLKRLQSSLLSQGVRVQKDKSGDRSWLVELI